MKYLKKPYLILLAIVFLGIMLRLYQIDNIPPGLNQDESALGYNAYSILKTGKDEHSIRYPIYFKSFNDNKMPGYFYLTAFFISLLGPTIAAVRMASFIAGIISILMIYLLVNKLLSAKNALMAAFLIAINPWHIFFSRAALEVNVATASILSGVYFFVLGVEKKKAWILAFSVVMFVFSAYTYSVTRLFAPLMGLMLLILYKKQVKKLPKQTIILLLSIATVGMLPLIYATFALDTSVSDQSAVFIFGPSAKANYIQLRSYVIGIPSIVSFLLFNSSSLALWKYLSNILGYFSVDFFFLTGNNPYSAGSTGNTSIGTHGMFYVFEIVTIVLGIIVTLKQKTTRLFIYWILLAIVVTSVSFVVPHGTRSYILIYPMTILSAIGIVYLFDVVSSLSSVWHVISKLAIIGIITVSIVYFYTSYLYRFPIEYADKWRSEEKELASYLLSQEDQYDKIIIDTKANVAYTSLLFYQLVDPNKHQDTSSYVPSGKLINLSTSGKYVFEDIDWQDRIEGNVLVVSRTDIVPDTYDAEHVLYYKQRPVVLEVNGEIAQYPTQDEAFALYKITNE